MVAGAAALFGTLSYITRQADDLGMGALPFVTWRGLVGTVVLVVFIQVLSVRAMGSELTGPAWLPRDGRLRLLIACALGAVVNIAMFAAFIQTTIAVALICFYTFPALVTLGALRLYGEQLSFVRAGALALSAAGLVLVVLSPALASGQLTLDPIGVGLALGGAVCQASFILIAGRGFAPLGPARVALLAIVAGALGAFVLALLAGDFAGLTVPLHDQRTWTWILLGGITGAAIPTTAFLVGIGLVGPSRASILMTIETLVAISLAALLLGERPTPLQLVGGVAVLAAAIILQLAPRGTAAAAIEPEVAPLV